MYLDVHAMTKADIWYAYDVDVSRTGVWPVAELPRLSDVHTISYIPEHGSFIAQQACIPGTTRDSCRV
jgi:hypothetical protein